MLIRIAQYMQETWGSHHVLKRGGALQRVKNDLKSIIVKPSPKKGFGVAYVKWLFTRGSNYWALTVGSVG